MVTVRLGDSWNLRVAYTCAHQRFVYVLTCVHVTIMSLWQRSQLHLWVLH